MWNPNTQISANHFGRVSYALSNRYCHVHYPSTHHSPNRREYRRVLFLVQSTTMQTMTLICHGSTEWAVCQVLGCDAAPKYSHHLWLLRAPHLDNHTQQWALAVKSGMKGRQFYHLKSTFYANSKFQGFEVCFLSLRTTFNVASRWMSTAVMLFNPTQSTTKHKTIIIFAAVYVSTARHKSTPTKQKLNDFNSYKSTQFMVAFNQISVYDGLMNMMEKKCK